MDAVGVAVGVAERAERIVALRDDVSASDDLVESGLAAVREIQSWADAQHAALVGKLSPDGFAEARVANAAKTSIGAATKSTQRSQTLTATPKLAEVLGDGQTTAGHLDAVTRAATQLATAQRSELYERVDALAAVASASTVEQFARRVAAEAKRIQSDDGLDRLARQPRNVRASSWVDVDGMWNLRSRFDPVTGVRLAARVAPTVEAMFAEAVPEGCPDDPFEKQKFLTGHALIALLDGTAGMARTGRPDYVVVVVADADPVVRNGVVPHAPGELNLGRSTRLANRALHHVPWRRHGGATNLDNLVPLCTKHHGRIHNDGWVIALGPHRELTLCLPDGTIHNTGPPSRRTAA